MPKWFGKNTLTTEDTVSILCQLALHELEIYEQAGRFSTDAEQARHWKLLNGIKKQYGSIRLIDGHVLSGDFTYVHGIKLREVAIVMAKDMVFNGTYIEINEHFKGLSTHLNPFVKTPEDYKTAHNEMLEFLKGQATYYLYQYDLY